jgi:hypothetical protein
LAVLTGKGMLKWDPVAGLQPSCMGLRPHGPAERRPVAGATTDEQKRCQ